MLGTYWSDRGPITLVSEAVILRTLSYQEAWEMASSEHSVLDEVEVVALARVVMVEMMVVDDYDVCNIAYDCNDYYDASVVVVVMAMATVVCAVGSGGAQWRQ
ncbi:hypothetical protein BHM03_00024955 [Ensete ventricosum]|nr:hypothetical protein BHM03_00024955 [Ensete ventricosum]